jgi:ribosomal protein S15P/S13E
MTAPRTASRWFELPDGLMGHDGAANRKRSSTTEMAKRTTCLIEGCGRALSARARSPVCPRCRSGFHYWDPKTPAQREEREEQLSMLKHRFEYMRAHVKAKRRGRDQDRRRRNIPPAAARMAA